MRNEQGNNDVNRLLSPSNSCSSCFRNNVWETTSAAAQSSSTAVLSSFCKRTTAKQAYFSKDTEGMAPELGISKKQALFRAIGYAAEKLADPWLDVEGGRRLPDWTHEVPL